MRHVMLLPFLRPACPALVLAVALSATACMDLDFSGMCLFGPCDGSSGSQEADPLPTLSFATQPTDATAGMPIVPAVRVSALDSTGWVDQTFAGLVILYVGDAKGLVLDSAGRIAQSGIAVFNSLTIALPGTGYRLWATAAGYAPDASEPFAITPAGAAVDQQQGLVDSSASSLTVGGLESQTFAQVVTAGMPGALVGVRLPIACEAGLTVEIRSVTNDIPGDSVLTAETYEPNSVSFGWTNTFHSLVLQNPISFAAGARLAIVLRSGLPCDVAQGPEGDSYSGGNGFRTGGLGATGTWQPLGIRADLPFQTLVR